jgi:hypothetical protein
MAKAAMVRLGPEVGPFIAKWAKQYNMSIKDFILTFVAKGLIEAHPKLAEEMKAGREPMTVERAEQILAWDGRVEV